MDWQNEVIWLLAGALITAAVGVFGAWINWVSTQHKIFSDKAWADYETRRDVYLELVATSGCLFVGGDPSKKPAFHEAARKVRIVGSDEVVVALNAFTSAAKGSGAEAEPHFYNLNLALRRDIRKIHALPPEGTRLEASAFPIES